MASWRRVNRALCSGAGSGTVVKFWVVEVAFVVLGADNAVVLFGG